jgi:hypothetical protein
MSFIRKFTFNVQNIFLKRNFNLIFSGLGCNAASLLQPRRSSPFRGHWRRPTGYPQQPDALHCSGKNSLIEESISNLNSKETAGKLARRKL